jgi:hypothetical protein
MKVLFDLADCEIVKESIQADFPAELCPVHMTALAARKKK